MGIVSRRATRVLLVFIFAAVFAEAAVAQRNSPVEVVTLRNLEFGTVFPGIPLTVPVTDAARRAEILLTGVGAADVTFTLPTALTSPTGQTIPVIFGGNSAAAEKGRGGALDYFDPAITTRVRINRDGTKVFVGGTVLAPETQVAGTYTAHMTVFVSRPNT